MPPARRLRIMLQLLTFIWLATVNINPAHSHGGVGIAEDTCVLTVGPFKFHFSGYQPERSEGEEFCEDIPYAGGAIIVLDHVDRALRTMLTDVRVIRDYKNLGIYARVEQLDGIETLEKHTIYYKKPALYPGGTIKAEIDFAKGNYIGMVTVKDPTDNSEFVAIFPFTVGYGTAGSILKYTAFIALLFLVFFGIYFFVLRAPSKP